MTAVIKAILADDNVKSRYHAPIGMSRQFMWRRLDACVSISQDLVKEFLASGRRLNYSHRLPNALGTKHLNGITPPPAALPTKLGLPEQQPIALLVGALDQRRNPLWLAEHWVEQVAFDTGTLLLVVCPQRLDDVKGALSRRLTDLAGQHPELLRLDDLQANLAPYYQCADVLVLPSVKEDLPNAVREAMTSALPLVAVRTNRSRDRIVEKKWAIATAPASSQNSAAPSGTVARKVGTIRAMPRGVLPRLAMPARQSPADTAPPESS